jgi:hypothetical protein
VLGAVLAFAGPQRRSSDYLSGCPLRRRDRGRSAVHGRAAGLTAHRTDKQRTAERRRYRYARLRHQGLSDVPHGRTIGTSTCELKASVGSPNGALCHYRREASVQVGRGSRPTGSGPREATNLIGEPSEIGRRWHSGRVYGESASEAGRS